MQVGNRFKNGEILFIEEVCNYVRGKSEQIPEIYFYSAACLSSTSDAASVIQERIVN